MNKDWTDGVAEWVNNKIYLLSTPLGAGVGIVGFVLGILIGKLILSM